MREAAEKRDMQKRVAEAVEKLCVETYGTLYNVKGAAQRMGGVSPWSVRAWLRDGRLARTKVGSRTMVSEKTILEFLAKCNAGRE